MPDYPGLGLDLRHNPKGERDSIGHHPIGAHGSCYNAHSDLLPIREVAMLSIMDRLTDKEDWHIKVFDDNIVSKWREEAMAIPDEHFNHLATRDKSQNWDVDVGEYSGYSYDPGLQPLAGIITTNTFDFCIKELRSKANYYEQSKLIPTLDACASIVKSDIIVSSKLHDELCRAFLTLRKDQEAAPDWHPNSGDIVQDLVHPSMYPLVYGRSRVLKEEVVNVIDAIRKWAGKGDVIPKDTYVVDPQRARYDYGVGGGTVPPYFWSNTYQWLPANLIFQDDGSLKFTSYINNLHPNKYPEIYRTIEKLVETSLPAWDQCLASGKGYGDKEGAGRIKSRFPYPDNPDDEVNENWIPSDPQEFANTEVNWEEVGDHDVEYNPEWDDETEQKWKLLRKPAIPEASFEVVDYAPSPDKRLADRFAKSGLQVIVKMASIELTPEKPEFKVGSWHIEGQMNEHICATSLYYLDSENISESNLSFRMQTDAYLNDDIQVGQDSYHWLEQIYGTNLSSGGSPCLQNYGSVETPQGRLLAFPNIFQHRVSSFHLKDPTKAGHRRFIALWLVDPFQRIISTANVPPQQMDWWLDSVLGSTPEAREKALSKLPAELVALMKEKGLDTDSSTETASAKLPQELMEITREHFLADGDMSSMGLEEAKEHRLKLMSERSAFVKVAEDGYQQHTYGFCEH